MDRAAIILAGGNSQRFKADKGLTDLAGKPLILYVIERVQDLVDEIVVCVKSDEKRLLYSSVLPKNSRIVVDMEGFPTCPLTGAHTGLMKTQSEYSILLPCDTPFISRRLIDLLFDIAVGVNAVIPRWPNGYIEPLQAVYRTKPAQKAARECLKRGENRMRSMISSLRKVRYLSTIVIREIDPKMLTFFNVNAPLDLRRAEVMIRKNAKLKHK